MLSYRFVVRALLYIILSWLSLVLLWIALPSPSHECEDPNLYSTSVLKSGKTLTRVYDFDAYFSRWSRLESIQEATATGRTSFAIDYTFDIPNQFLGLGTDRLVQIVPPTTLPSLSEQFQTNAKVGDQDGVSLPWFSKADATLLYGLADLYGQGYATLSLRTYWTRNGTFQLWPDHPFWTTFDAKVNSGTPGGMSPLITLDGFAARTAYGLNVTLLNEEWNKVRVSLPSDEWNESPSYTFPIRMALLGILRPSVLGVAAFVELSGMALRIIWVIVKNVYFTVMTYILFVALVWVSKSRPPLKEFMETSVVTRYLYKRVWPLEEVVVGGDSDKGKMSGD